MKYRIKKVELEDLTLYFPQRKKYFFWCYYHRHNFIGNIKISFDSETEALNYIKNHKNWPVITYKEIKP